MPLSKEAVKQAIASVKNKFMKDPYLAERYEAQKWERTGRVGPQPRRAAELHDPEHRKLGLFDRLIPALETEEFQLLMETVEDGKTAEKYLQSLSEHMELMQSLEVPSRENHGMEKIMEPADYEKLQASCENLLKQTKQLMQQFGKIEKAADIKAEKKAGIRQAERKVPNRLVSRENCKKQFAWLASVGRYVYQDAGMAEKLAQKKEAVTLGTALKNAEGIRVTGATDDENVVGAAQSSRKIITLRDKNGREITGLFTPKRTVNTENPAPADHMAMNQLGASKGDRLDQRNSAMTTVAELLGRSDLLAHSEEMRIDSEASPQNPTGAGTFMEVVNGTDMARLLPDSDFFQVDTRGRDRNIFTDKAKKDMMDLTVVDYLCANMDRHGHNIIYDYQQGDDGVMRLNGLKGIDNDSSFTAFSIPVTMPVNRLTALADTICISEAMADKLKNMTEEKLMKDMAPFRFHPEELLAMGERLRNLQEALAAGDRFRQEQLEANNGWDAFLKDGMGYMTNKRNIARDHAPCLVTIPDEKLKQLKVEALGNVRQTQMSNGRQISTGVFNIVCSIHTPASQRAARGRAQERQLRGETQLQSSTVLREGIADFQTIAKEARNNTEHFVRECAAKTSRLRGTSPEFERMAETLRAIRQATENMSRNGYRPNNMDQNVLTELHNRLQKDCKEYLDHKEAERQSGRKRSSYAETRMELAREVYKYARTENSRIQTMWNEELSAENTRMARGANAISQLSRQMKPLRDYMAARKDPEQSGIDPAEAANRLKQELPGLCRRLKEFDDASGKLPGVQDAVELCAKRIRESVGLLGGEKACGIGSEERSALSACERHTEALHEEKIAESQPSINTL